MPRGNRNPYEIRYDTLTLAKDILSENASAQREVQDQLRSDNVEDHPPGLDTLYEPHTFSTQDVIDEATKLYGFIDPPDTTTPRTADAIQEGLARRRVTRPTRAEGRPTLSAIQEASELPGDALPATHPDHGKRVTVLNNPDLHVSLSTLPPGDAVYVWFEDHAYQGKMFAPSTKKAEVRGIFPGINDPKILDRIEAALSKHLRGTRVKLRFHDETEFPPLTKRHPLNSPTIILHDPDQDLEIIELQDETLLITHDGQSYPARIRQTSSSNFLIIPEEPLPLSNPQFDTIEQAVAEHLGQDVHVRFQGR